MNKKNLRASAFILAIAVAWMISGFFAPGDPEVFEPEVKNQKVITINSNAQDFSLPITVKGESQAFSKVDIKAQTSEKVIKINFSDGDFAKKGQVICELDSGQRRANFKKAEIDYNSTKELNKKGLASQSALVTTETVYETARIELSRTKIVAPFDGFVEKLAKEGQLIQNGQMCATIVSLSPLKVAGNVSELVVSKIKRGQRASIEFISGEKFESKVTFVSSTADLQTRTFKVESELENENYLIKDGLTGDLIIYTDPVKAHFVPTSAFLLATDGDVALAEVVDGKINIVTVQILIDTTEGAWVTGLAEVSKVVVSGQGFVKPGEEVDVIEK